MKKLTLMLLMALVSISTFSQNLTIHFDFDKSELSEESIISVSELIKTNNPKKLTLKGFADTIGTNNYNSLLVEKRLEAVEKAIHHLDDRIKIEKINLGEDISNSGGSRYRKVEIFIPQTTYRVKEPNYKRPQNFFIDNRHDTAITCAEGTKIKIPQNCLVVKESKDKPTGLIQILVTEYYKVHEMIDANLTTHSGDEMLETGGMLYIQAKFNDKKCVIDESAQIEIHFKDITEQDSMQLFTGNDTNGDIDWELVNLPSNMLVSKEKEFMRVENMPTFLGGDIRSFQTYVNARLKYPVVAQENGIQGKVVVSFTVDEFGLIKNPEIVRSNHPSLEDEVLRVIRSTPQWLPGTQRGQPVPVQITVPFIFVLNGGFPINENNRIPTSSDFDAFVQNDSVIRNYEEINQFIREFYLRTNKLGWINCDRFFRFANLRDIKIQVETMHENYFAIFNNNRSIMRPNAYNDRLKISTFNNIPANQKPLIIGIKIVNEKTYFTSFEAKLNGDIYTPSFEGIDKQELIDKMKALGL